MTSLKPSVTKSRFDHLKLPDGRAVGEVKDVTSILTKMGVPGVDHANGRETNLEAFAKHVSEIHDAAGNAAVEGYLASKRSEL